MKGRTTLREAYIGATEVQQRRFHEGKIREGSRGLSVPDAEDVRLLKRLDMRLDSYTFGDFWVALRFCTHTLTTVTDDPFTQDATYLQGRISQEKLPLRLRWASEPGEPHLRVEDDSGSWVEFRVPWAAWSALARPKRCVSPERQYKDPETGMLRVHTSK